MSQLDLFGKKPKKDTACNPPLCIRRITRLSEYNDYRFDVTWRTSAGVITSKGWRWIRSHNRIVAPMCNGHHIFALPADVRAAIRKLFTRLMQEQRGITIPAIGKARFAFLTAQNSSENLLRDNSESNSQERNES